MTTSMPIQAPADTMCTTSTPFRARAPNLHGRERPGLRPVIAPPSFGRAVMEARRPTPSPDPGRPARTGVLCGSRSRGSIRPVARSGLGVPLAMRGPTTNDSGIGYSAHSGGSSFRRSEANRAK